MAVQIPAQASVTDGAFALDGGSIDLSLTTSAGAAHRVLLVQHVSRRDHDGRCSGRLYFDGQLLAIRSQEEMQLIALLKSAAITAADSAPATGTPGFGASPAIILGDDIRAYAQAIAQGPKAATTHLVQSLLAYVESDEYVRFATRQWWQFWR